MHNTTTTPHSMLVRGNMKPEGVKKLPSAGPRLGRGGDFWLATGAACSPLTSPLILSELPFLSPSISSSHVRHQCLVHLYLFNICFLPSNMIITTRVCTCTRHQYGSPYDTCTVVLLVDCTRAPRNWTSMLFPWDIAYEGRSFCRAVLLFVDPSRQRTGLFVQQEPHRVSKLPLSSRLVPCTIGGGNVGHPPATHQQDLGIHVLRNQGET